jgi:hypothetical protein
MPILILFGKRLVIKLESTTDCTYDVEMQMNLVSVGANCARP